MSLAEPSHIGLFPLQFREPTQSEEQLAASMVQYSGRQRRDRTRRVTLRETEEREGREVRETAQCECRNCQLERKYEKKRRKKSERVTWS